MRNVNQQADTTDHAAKKPLVLATNQLQAFFLRLIHMRRYGRRRSETLCYTVGHQVRPCVDTQKYLFYEVVKMWNRLHYCVPLVETVKKTYTKHLIQSSDERVMPLGKSTSIGSCDSRRQF
jgi:hypothetical protein